MRTNRDDEYAAYVAQRRGGLLRTATFLTSGDRHAAEDLVQTALMRVYVAWPRVKPETVDAYARKAMLNALIDARRRPAHRLEQSHAQPPETPVDDPAPTDRETAVFRALAGLPPRMRAAVVLRHLTELSVAETAAALNCSEGTVKSQTARALTQLRLGLSQELDSPVLTATPGLPTDGSASVDREHAVDSVRTSIHRGSHE